MSIFGQVNLDFDHLLVRWQVIKFDNSTTLRKNFLSDKSIDSEKDREIEVCELCVLLHKCKWHNSIRELYIYLYSYHYGYYLDRIAIN